MSSENNPIPPALNEALSEISAIADPTACMCALQRWNSEILAFYGRRMQHYWSLPGQMFTCGTADDLLKMQEKFYARTIEDYRHQGERMAVLMKADDAGGEMPAVSYEETLLKAQADARELIEQARHQAQRIVASAEERAKELAATTSDAKSASKTKAA